MPTEIVLPAYVRHGNRVGIATVPDHSWAGRTMAEVWVLDFADVPLAYAVAPLSGRRVCASCPVGSGGVCHRVVVTIAGYVVADVLVSHREAYPGDTIDVDAQVEDPRL